MFSEHHVRIIGVPLGLGGRRKGANLGPDALRLAGIVEQTQPFVRDVFDGGDVEALQSLPTADRGPGLGYFEEVLANLVEVRKAVASAMGSKSILMILGGDHSIEMATIPAAIESGDSPLGVLWIDAHADFNTPDTSPSGNLHGMALAAVCGLPCGPCEEPKEEQWGRLLKAIAPNNRFLSPKSIVWFGLRDVDAGEAEKIGQGSTRQGISMHEIDRYGIPAMLEQAVEHFRQAGIERLWVSFDADVLDPQIAPGTGTTVRGGINYREAHLLAEMIHEVLTSRNAPIQLVGMKIAEVNPILDHQNATASMCVEWVASLLGKRILPRQSDSLHESYV